MYITEHGINLQRDMAMDAISIAGGVWAFARLIPHIVRTSFFASSYNYSASAPYIRQGTHINFPHSFLMSWAGFRSALIVYYK